VTDGEENNTAHVIAVEENKYYTMCTYGRWRRERGLWRRENNSAHEVCGEENNIEHLIGRRKHWLTCIGEEERKEQCFFMTSGDENNTTQVNVGKENNVAQSHVVC
jgi:hypothetical protein